jgi:hypothetical protein
VLIDANPQGVYGPKALLILVLTEKTMVPVHVRILGRYLKGDYGKALF